MIALLLPAITIAIALFVYFRYDQFPQELHILLPYFPYLIFPLGAFLSIRFNRSNSFFMLLLQGALLLLLPLAPALTTDEGLFRHILTLGIGLLIPLNLLLFSLFKERGFLTLWGVLRGIWVISQLILLPWLITSGQIKEYPWLYKMLPSFLGTTFGNIPQVAALALVLTLGLLILQYILKGGEQIPAFMGCNLLAALAMVTSFPRGTIIFLTASAFTLTLAIIQASYHMSYLDELTGLPARRALKEEMLKLSGTYTISMVDIDFFKKFNDKHGHEVGDEVLRMVAACLRKVTGGGKAFRYGGEEFTILFPGKELKDTLSHLEALRKLVEERPFVVRGKGRTRKQSKGKLLRNNAPKKSLHVTISIGVAQRNAQAKAPMEVMKLADKALYRAKKKGRNCVSK